VTVPVHIRAYVVGFGDCVLLMLPDADTVRHILIDFGRAPNDGGSLERFPAIAEDISRQCNGHLDLVIMTHEHLDHMEGFFRQRDVFDHMEVDQVWMSLPSHPDYYTMYQNAKPQKKLRDALLGFAEGARRNAVELHPAFRSLLDNNVANEDRIRYLRELGHNPVVYLARGKKGAAARKWSKNIKIQVLAPEEDVSVYYSSQANSGPNIAALAAFGGRLVFDPDDDSFRWDFPGVRRGVNGDLPGFSTSDFDRLRRLIREDGVAAARFIDRAQNNTSLCLMIEVAGKRLLLPGDAEIESWDMMRKKCKSRLKPVDFLKVAHHGSHNGTPLDLLDVLLPLQRREKATVLVSTKRNVYGTENPVPDSTLLLELKSRCRNLVTTDGLPGTFVDMEI
jgi:hypothetical protein